MRTHTRDFPTVIHLFSGSHEELGLRVGDRIVAIDGVFTRAHPNTLDLEKMLEKRPVIVDLLR
jgi:C-terminal processing protease CtpA/Prc